MMEANIFTSEKGYEKTIPILDTNDDVFTGDILLGMKLNIM